LRSASQTGKLNSTKRRSPQLQTGSADNPSSALKQKTPLRLSV
jgi:hypothetical protein